MNLALLKYVKSFSEGRIRLRHPALHNEATARITKEGMLATAGVNSVEINCLSGSVLILYDASLLSKDQLIAMGVAWAEYLDTVKAGKAAEPPSFA